VIPERKSQANAGVGIGIVLQLFGLFVSGGDTSWLLGAAVILAGAVVFIRGCMHYAEGRGVGPWALGGPEHLFISHQ
jgi:hypothetical protein